jgi:hypothetical protein
MMKITQYQCAAASAMQTLGAAGRIPMASARRIGSVGKIDGRIDEFAIAEIILVATSSALRANPPTNRNERPGRRVDPPNCIAGRVRTLDCFAIVPHLATSLIPRIVMSY